MSAKRRNPGRKKPQQNNNQQRKPQPKPEPVAPEARQGKVGTVFDLTKLEQYLIKMYQEFCRGEHGVTWMSPASEFTVPFGNWLLSDVEYITNDFSYDEIRALMVELKFAANALAAEINLEEDENDNAQGRVEPSG